MIKDTAFTTTSWRLEQFLFAHDIRFLTFHKNLDGMTEWVYEKNPEVMEVVEEYRRIDARRRARKEA